MTARISERSFEEAIECALLQPAACHVARRGLPQDRAHDRYVKILNEGTEPL